MQRALTVVGLALSIALVGAPAAAATVPGVNGRIAYSVYGKIYTLNPDGSFSYQVRRADEDDKRDFFPSWSPDGKWIVTAGQVLDHEPGQTHWSDLDITVFLAAGFGFTRLGTPHQTASSTPAWSPDGKRVLYASDELGPGGLQTARIDGSDVQHLGATGFDPAWSPDGQRIVYSSAPWGDYDYELYTARADGTDVQKLLTRDGQETQPAWSPDGSEVAFTATGPRVEIPPAGFSYPGSNVYVMPAGGGTPVQLTHTNLDGSPSWSPDGRSIVFESGRDYPSTSRKELYVMDADGGHQHGITSTGCFQCDPDWGTSPVLKAPPPPQRPPTGSTPALPQGVIGVSLSTRKFRWRAAKRIWVNVLLTDRGRVRFTIAKVGGHHGRRVWRKGHGGANRYRLGSLFRKPLKPGVYRLVVTPRKGVSKTIRLRILRRSPR